MSWLSCADAAAAPCGVSAALQMSPALWQIFDPVLDLCNRSCAPSRFVIPLEGGVPDPRGWAGVRSVTVAGVERDR
jgi:hypothetical protein